MRGGSRSPSDRRATGRRSLVGLLLALAVLVLALTAPEAMGSTLSGPTAASPGSATGAGAVAAGSSTGLTPSSTPLSPARTQASSSASEGSDDDGPQVAVAGEAPPPVRLRIPSIGVDSALDTLATDATGELEAPPRWQVAGWFSGGARPGESGAAVIAGHIDSPTGPAVFAELAALTAGDIIRVTQRGGRVATFRVDRTQVAAKDAFPTRSVYQPTPDAQLRLITCDGPYVKASGGYQDNLIVYATKTTESSR